MSHTSRNFIVAYVLLVGLPLLGLAGVLRNGRTLTAPISMDGVWKIEADAVHFADQPCAKAMTSLLNGSVVISQSGKNLALSFNNPARTVGTGIIEGKSLHASIISVRDAVDTSCTGDHSPTLTAIVDTKADPRSLSGQLSLPGCTSCAPLEFHAVRQPRAGSAGAH